jgi:ABC-type Fe3+-siderophore transport system permease subunit
MKLPHLILASVLLLLISRGVYAVPESTAQQNGVIIENVRIFNGISSALSAPSNVLIVGNVIKTIPLPIRQPQR